MYQSMVDFLNTLAAWNASLYALAVVFTVALAGLALHGLYTLVFRLAARLVRRP